MRAHVRPGRIVDIGCGAGAVLELADREPALRESDLIGVEVARHLYEECVHKKAQGVFRNPNVFFYRRNVLGGAVLPARSVDTTLTFALTHEIWSYGSQRASLRRVRPGASSTTPCPAASGSTATSAARTAATGRCCCAARDDGANPASPRSDLAELPRDEVSAYVAGLSTRARLDQFAVDFRVPVRLRGASATATVAAGARRAMDFLTRKDYTDNWLSETQEQFCGLEFADWKALLTDVGFELDPASRHHAATTGSSSNRLAPVAVAAPTSDGTPLDWPVTHILFVARRPLNTCQ